MINSVRFQKSRIDGSDGTADDWGLKGHGFNPQLRQVKGKNILSCFRLVALEPLRSTSNCMPHCLCIHVTINNLGCIIIIQIQMQSLTLKNWCWKNGWFELLRLDPDSLCQKMKNRSFHGRVTYIKVHKQCCKIMK